MNQDIGSVIINLKKMIADDNLLSHWNNSQKQIPPRPQYPEDFPIADKRHWYDYEYGGWLVQKVNIPDSPADGPEGKRVIGLCPGLDHPYVKEYIKAMTEVADKFRITFETFYANWSDEVLDENVLKAIKERPDLIILCPNTTYHSTEWYRMINAAGIPVIASNMKPALEGFKYVLAWTGPDDWGQFRMLAAKFAEFMNYEGGFAIIQHVPGGSSFYSRTYSVITELNNIAPQMKCLEMESTELDPEKTYETVLRWINLYGMELQGLISPDDCGPMIGINRALKKRNRQDIIRVSAGNTMTGMTLLKEGKLRAMTFQSPRANGALAMKTAVDWFNGLNIDPVIFLPKYIITQKDVDYFFLKKYENFEIDMGELKQALTKLDYGGADDFFNKLYQYLVINKFITLDFFRGMILEIVSYYIAFINKHNMEEKNIIVDYETLYKNSFLQKSLENTLACMQRISHRIIEEIKKDNDKRSVIDEVINYINKNYMEHISLKTLSDKYKLSQGYLGRLIKIETGTHFPSYLNSLRVLKAKEMFRHSMLNIKEVAYKVGFSDHNYFYSVFKKIEGVAPSEYRESIF